MPADRITPPRTALANRTTIRRALFAIEQICAKDNDVLLSEIDDLATLCQVIVLSAKKWRTAENLILTAETNRRRGAHA